MINGLLSGRTLVGVLLIGSQLFVACDSVDSEPGIPEPGIPEPKVSVALSVFTPGEERYDVLVRSDGDDEFVEMPNGDLGRFDNMGGTFSPDGSTLLYSRFALLPSYGSKPVVEYHIGVDSTKALPVVNDNSFNYIWAVDPFSIRLSPSNSKIALSHNAPNISGHDYMQVYDRDLEYVYTNWESNFQAVPIGWISELEFLALGFVSSKNVARYRANASLIELVEMNSEVISDRVGEEWTFVSGHLHSDGVRFVAEIRYLSASSSKKLSAVALFNISDGSADWISQSLESSDGRPVWGPNDTVYYVSSASGDSSFEADGVVVKVSLTNGQRETVFQNELAGRSAIGIGLHW